jgi:hypothetical protein
MLHPKSYLMQKILDWRRNGLSSLGELHAKHVDDIANVMLSYAEESVIEAANLLAAGETIQVGENAIKLEFKNQCKHKWVRTTKDYKPARKCVECGEVKLRD